MTTREVMIVHHTNRPRALETATEVEARFARCGIDCVGPEAAHADRVELVLSLGGDGTMLLAAEAARAHDVPLLGVNFGHMGFLTAADGTELEAVIDAIVTRSYRVEPRMVLEAHVTHPDQTASAGWAFNEAAIVSSERAQPTQFGVGIDGRGISTYGADGIIVATPTGSTAYSFSAGGPIVWPDVEAVVMAPLSAHGLFTRPLVISPSSTLEVYVLANQAGGVEIWFDGRRHECAAPGSTIRLTKSARPVRLALVSDVPFSGRLVNKFDLPIKGWRSHPND